ncbi:heavy-metal-associated domain-containing protein [Zunongwangia sp. H14]|uniref:heavy-metal-associated domain-containing protein n=1 Tax=Zunongwangia sp. H14 TaxID=3240792 RepID=UPI003561AA9E
MKREYHINGIGCGGCVTRIKKVLETHPTIERTEVFLIPKGATIITMKETLPVDELQKQLNILEGFTIEEIKKQPKN